MICLLAFAALIAGRPALGQHGREWIDDPKMIAATQRAIEKFGFACDRVGLLSYRGQGPRGTILEARCGPLSGGIYPSQHYRIDLMRDGRGRVSVWPER